MRISMRRSSTLGCLAIALWGLPLSIASAQPPAPDPAQAAVDVVQSMAEATKRQTQRDPLARSSLTLPEPQLTLETTRGKGRATGTIGLVRTHPGGETTFGLAISGPIGDAEDAESRPVDLRGLGDGASVSFSVGGSSVFKSFTNKEIIAVCTSHQVAMQNCTAGKLEDQAPDVSDELLGLAFRQWPILYSGSVTFGRNKFSFYDSAGTKQNPVRKNDFQIEGSVGLMVNRRRDLLAVHLGYSDVFNPSSNKTQLCRPLANSNVTRCDAAIIGEPVEESGVITTIEYRWQLRGKASLPVAFAPKFQFSIGTDGTEGVRSLEAPFYFFQAKPDPKAASPAPKLNGGVSAGWRSDNGFQLAVFIGTTFNLFKL
jgi:hypothetical protein